MMGSDIERLQTLIDSLERMKEEENSNTTNTDNIDNTTVTENIVENTNTINAETNETVE